MEKNKSDLKHDRNYKIGIFAALSSSTLWGVLPIYWKNISPIPPFVIIFYRILLVAIVSFFISKKRYGIKKIVEPFRKKEKKFLLKFFIVGVLITLNWSIYIWAVNSNYIIQTSIGYYIEPLFVCVIGILFFKEKITRFNSSAMIFALIGMITLIIHYRQVPSIALMIGITFAVYAAAKKTLKAEPELSLFYETMFLAPVCVAIIIYLEMSGMGAINSGGGFQYFLLMLSGFATAIPLGLFATAANRLPMITLGITSYISPSLALVLGVVLYKEPFDSIQFFAFVIVWVGLVIFTIGEYKTAKMKKSEKIKRL